ncbi:hypothetical protein FXF51_02040 [Nonomuraea sp. PA05]|uniref:hypothetical protein n=1 Tax=Nonomuraea sp. PA05 TaxID=2604466 RepID=UPI0011D5543F|nr:hypothetical protein [Nonomuraea sp. PA05]TYB71241.1 hypothetical protein FXF51_02040 [Nonomuraea sp. PA05]
MWRYTNANTGQVVDVPERDACLDMLPNWTATRDPAEPAVAGAGSPLPPSLVDVVAAATQGIRPPEGAKKDAWIAYAVARGMAEADARALRKDALIEEFGENSDDDEEGSSDGQD